MWWDLSISVPSRICTWDKKMSQSRPYIFFRTKICSNPLPKEMRSCGIPSQLKNFPFLISNEAGWDGICQSHFRPAYVIGIKKCLTPVPKFFYGTKICPNPVLNGMRSRRIPSHREKLSSLVARQFCLYFKLLCQKNSILLLKNHIHI